MRRQVGFTLLEVLAALALLALLLLGVYSGIRTATHSVRSGTATVERLDLIRSTQQFLRRELAQSLAQPISRTDKGENLYFEGSAREMRFVAPLPGYLGKLGPQLQRLQLVSGEGGRVRLEWSAGLLPLDGSPPRPLGDPQVLLEGIEGGSFSYRGMDGDGQLRDWSDVWPDGRLLPQLVSIQLRLDGRQGWPTLQVPLRVDPATDRPSVQLPRMSLSPGGSL